ncbi:MAG: hypothetical protein K8I02_00485, partial [Candidatus Methylomirabilis sp.]|nr:hypothetical protein [Deltaproteobacteria bacterium]
MLILGLACFGTHDSGVCITRDGEILYAAEEALFSRVKHDPSFPERALAFGLERLGLTLAEFDHVAFFTDLKATTDLHLALWNLVRYFPRSLQTLKFLRYHSRNTSLPDRLAERYGYRGPVHYVRHHYCHAASTFFVSPFERAAILTLDGTGEWTTTTMGVGEGNTFRNLREVKFPHSLGRVYETFTQYLGFRPRSAEGKVMGLASYGEPVYRNEFAEILRLKDDGTFELDMSFFNFHTGGHLNYTLKLVRLFGPPREPESRLTARHENVAASLQRRIEEAAVHMARRLARDTGLRDLCLAGGVALNCKMNARILEDGSFDRVYVVPAAGDPGTALGAAKYVEHMTLGRPRSAELVRPYLGPEYSEAEIERALADSGEAYERVEDPADRAAALLEEGRIVAWFQGPVEFGPRALGGRSILADPRDPKMKDVLNTKVKRRETFRPFAPAVLEERMSEYAEA